LRGRISADQLRVTAELAANFSHGEIRTTIMQNLALVNMRNEYAATVAKKLEEAGLPVSGSVFARGTIACTGSEFCKLALTETKGFARWLVEELENRVPGFDQQLKLHIAGCPNSCGQHWIADIGIEGKKIKVDGKMVDAYYFCVGGALGRFAAIGRPVGYRCAAAEVPDAIERLLRAFENERNPGENQRQYFARHSNDEIRSLLAGEWTESEERDAVAGPVPHGVEG
jgi:sulfite reductase (ferredoxin)